MAFFDVVQSKYLIDQALAIVSKVEKDKFQFFKYSNHDLELQLGEFTDLVQEAQVCVRMYVWVVVCSMYVCICVFNVCMYVCMFVMYVRMDVCRVSVV